MSDHGHRGLYDPERFWRQYQEDIERLPRPSWASVWLRNPVAGFIYGFLLSSVIVVAACLLIPITDPAVSFLLGMVVSMVLTPLGIAWGDRW